MLIRVYDVRSRTCVHIYNYEHVVIFIIGRTMKICFNKEIAI